MTSPPPADSNRPRISRRRFGLISAGLVLLLVIARLWPFRRRPMAPQVSSDGEALPPETVDTLVAFGDVLLPSRFSSESIAYHPGEDPEGPLSVVRDTIVLAAESHPAAALSFKAGASVLDRAGGRHRFAELNLTERRSLVTELIGRYTRSGPVARRFLALTPRGREAAALWEDVARPILAGFYGSFWGWRAMGYPAGRGVCNDLIEYQSKVGS